MRQLTKASVVPAAVGMSRSVLVRLAIASAALAVASCAPVVRTPLSEVHRQAITTSKAVGNLSQNEIAAGLGTVGSMIGVMADEPVKGERAARAARGLAVFHELLAGYDPRPALPLALARELEQVAGFRHTAVELRREPLLDKLTLTAMVDTAGTDAVLVVDFQYRFSERYDAVIVTGVAMLLATKAAASPVLQKAASTPSSESLPSAPLYRGVFVSCMAPVDGADLDDWVKDKGSAAKAAIEGGMAEVVRMLAWDLEQGGPDGSLYSVPGVSRERIVVFGPQPWWYRLRERDGRTWYRGMGGEVVSLGKSYPGYTLTAFAPAAPPPPPSEIALPVPTARGGLTYELANTDYTRQGGTVEIAIGSAVPGDVAFKEKTFTEGVITVRGKIGLGKGTTSGWLGPRIHLQPRAAPMDATRFVSVTVRVAATTKVIRIRLVGPEREPRDDGCYPVYDLEVSDQLKEYVVPLTSFAPESWCAVRGRSLRQTLPRLVGFEVVGTRVTGLPLSLSVGSVTLNR